MNNLQKIFVKDKAHYLKLVESARSQGIRLKNSLNSERSFLPEAIVINVKEKKGNNLRKATYLHSEGFRLSLHPYAEVVEEIKIAKQTKYKPRNKPIFLKVNPKELNPTLICPYNWSSKTFIN